ncbi:hypothetical protein [Flavobacterium cyclinae]|uniref:hypothetical protein n=1 Tax=Flavobacterium cyclinae TaxID=2895947 RepID=UPI001E43AAE2|nr:hypothetical protein [Flavobacterium cyclinae]UGS20259.1 hypothetical protein LOS86_09510 [Flavobacterium cyclinae]
MKHLKSLLLFLFFVSTVSYAQKFNFKTSGYMVSQKDNKGNWSDWSKLQKSEMTVLLDMESHRIVVYSEILQLFSIMKYGNQETIGDDDVVKFDCVDNNGVECILTIYTRKKQGGRNQLYITYQDMIIAYNMTVLEDNSSKKK